MKQIVIEISDRADGTTQTKLSEDWAKMRRKYDMNELEPGAEMLAFVGMYAITNFLIAKKHHDKKNQHSLVMPQGQGLILPPHLMNRS